MATPPLVLTANLESFVIERQKIRRAADRATRRSIVRSLAYIRNTARRNVLRNRKRVSRPGQAPSVRSKDGNRSLRFILFHYDQATRSGFVGPLLISRQSYGVATERAQPGTLEFGGAFTVHQESYNDGRTWYVRSQRRRVTAKTKQRRSIKTRIRARPFMITALEIEQQKGNILSPWANAVR